MSLKRLDEKPLRGAIVICPRPLSGAREPRPVQPYRVDKKARLFLVKPGTLAVKTRRDHAPMVTLRPPSERSHKLVVLPKPAASRPRSLPGLRTCAWLAPVAWLGHGLFHWLHWL